LKVYSCFVDFQKAFDTVPREALFQRLRDIGISETLLVAIMRLYESVLGRLRMAHDLSDFIQSTIRVKQGAPSRRPSLGSILMSWSPSSMSTSRRGMVVFYIRC
jgi:hypothetical protein